MKKKGIRQGLLAIVLATGFGQAFALESNEEITVLQGLQEDENFSTLVSLLESSGLSEQLSSSSSITLFAPTNQAFDTLGEEQLNALSTDSTALTEVLQMHVSQGEYLVLDLDKSEEGAVSSLSGEPYAIEQSASGLSVNGADLISTDVDNVYSNGVVHAISNVVLPATMVPATDTNGDGVVDDQDTATNTGSGATDTTTTDESTTTEDSTTTDDASTDETSTDDSSGTGN
ncbi:MAG: fasciclin domain-containing protein [Trueperaceae bacterium]